MISFSAGNVMTIMFSNHFYFDIALLLITVVFQFSRLYFFLDDAVIHWPEMAKVKDFQLVARLSQKDRKERKEISPCGSTENHLDNVNTRGNVTHRRVFNKRILKVTSHH